MSIKQCFFSYNYVYFLSLNSVYLQRDRYGLLKAKEWSVHDLQPIMEFNFLSTVHGDFRILLQNFCDAADLNHVHEMF